MVVLITNSDVVRLEMIFVLALHVIEEDAIISFSSGVVRSVVHLVERNFLQGSVVHVLVSLAFVGHGLFEHLIFCFYLKIISHTKLIVTVIKWRQ